MKKREGINDFVREIFEISNNLNGSNLVFKEVDISVAVYFQSCQLRWLMAKMFGLFFSYASVLIH